MRFSPMTFNTEELPRTPCSKGFGSTKAVQKFWILRKRLETQGQEMAPQVGLEPTTLRLTAGCSAIELLRSVGKGSEEHTSELQSPMYLPFFPPRPFPQLKTRGKKRAPRGEPKPTPPGETPGVSSLLPWGGFGK